MVQFNTNANATAFDSTHGITKDFYLLFVHGH
jgi:hypothetical protein